MYNARLTISLLSLLFYILDNVVVKVPKSVVALLFFMVFILGVLAMEWWFPWLTGENKPFIH